MDFGLDPVHRKAHQTDPFSGVKAFYGLHQAHVAFLHQVAQWQAVTGVAAGDVGDKAQVRQDQAACRIQVLIVIQSFAKALFFLCAEYRHGVNGSHVGVQVVTWYG